jgi:hypothetical protein
MPQFNDIGDNRSRAFRGESPMSEPKIAQKSPFAVAVEAGKSHLLVRLWPERQPAFLRR